MRRSPFVLAGTAAGLAGVLSFHARSPAPLATAAAASPSAAPATTTTTPVAGAGTNGGSASGTTVTTGKAVATPYGNAQVRVTITNGKISKIEALQLQGNDPKSVQISGSAEPTLRSEALQAQSAAIDVVSGATYTSASYEQSLQSALDKAHFKAAGGAKATATVPTGPARGEHDGGPGGDRGFDGGGFDGGFQPGP